MDAVARRIASTGGQLTVVEDALDGWKHDNEKQEPWVRQFKRYESRSCMIVAEN